jgi:hypothetical protein
MIVMIALVFTVSVCTYILIEVHLTLDVAVTLLDRLLNGEHQDDTDDVTPLLGVLSNILASATECSSIQRVSTSLASVITYKSDASNVRTDSMIDAIQQHSYWMLACLTQWQVKQPLH